LPHPVQPPQLHSSWETPVYMLTVQNFVWINETDQVLHRWMLKRWNAKLCQMVNTSISQDHNTSFFRVMRFNLLWESQISYTLPCWCCFTMNNFCQTAIYGPTLHFYQPLPSIIHTVIDLAFHCHFLHCICNKQLHMLVRQNSLLHFRICLFWLVDHDFRNNPTWTKFVWDKRKWLPQRYPFKISIQTFHGWEAVNFPQQQHKLRSMCRMESRVI